MISRADQIRQAIREAVRDEPDGMKIMAETIAAMASDTALEKLARLIK